MKEQCGDVVNTLLFYLSLYLASNENMELCLYIIYQLATVKPHFNPQLLFFRFPLEFSSFVRSYVALGRALDLRLVSRHWFFFPKGCSVHILFIGYDK